MTTKAESKVMQQQDRMANITGNSRNQVWNKVSKEFPGYEIHNRN